MDIATDYRTRPGMAKVRVEIDLTKPLINFVWVGQDEKTNPLKGFTHKLEYEGLPKYGKHCRILGHSVTQCRALERDEIIIGVTQGRRTTIKTQQRRSRSIQPKKHKENRRRKLHDAWDKQVQKWSQQRGKRKEGGRDMTST